MQGGRQQQHSRVPAGPPASPGDFCPVDLDWLVEPGQEGPPAEDPSTSTATTLHHPHASQDVGLMPPLPELMPLHHTRPLSAASGFSAGASSPAAIFTPFAAAEAQASFPAPLPRPSVNRTSKATGADPTTGQAAAQEATEDRRPQRKMRAAAKESAKKPAAAKKPSAAVRVKLTRSKSGAGRDEDQELLEAVTEAGTSWDGGGTSQGVSPRGGLPSRALRKRPPLSYAPSKGESDSDASSAPRTEDEEGRQEGGGDGEEDEEEEEEEEEAPKKPQRGRKRRTEPVVIEREDGTKEEVSPQDWRRLRRRVTNRLSARRMRQKRAEERDAVAAETRQLHKDNAQLKARAEELEAANRALAAEAYRWQRRYEDLYGQAAAAGQAPPADAPPAASLEHGPYFAPTPDRRQAHSLPTASQQQQPQHQQQQQQQQQQMLPELQQRSVSPGGFEAFTLPDLVPLMSPHAGQQPPLFVALGGGTPPHALPGQSPPSSQQQPPFGGGGGGLSARRSLGSDYILPSPVPDLATPADREAPLRTSQAIGHPPLQLQSPHFHTSPDLQRLSRSAPGDSPAALLSPRHFSAPNLGAHDLDLLSQLSPFPPELRTPPPPRAQPQPHQPAQQQHTLQRGGDLEARSSAYSDTAYLPQRMGFQLRGSYPEPGAGYGLAAEPQPMTPRGGVDPRSPRGGVAARSLQEAQAAFSMQLGYRRGNSGSSPPPASQAPPPWAAFPPAPQPQRRPGDPSRHLYDASMQPRP